MLYYKSNQEKGVVTIGLFKTIRSRLFISYTSIIAAVVFAFAASFYIYTAAILEKRASESLQQLAINVNPYLDAEFKNMSATANRIISSDPIKDIFFDPDTLETGLAQKRWNLYQLLFTVTGSSTSNQINLIGADGSVAQFGKRFEMAPPRRYNSSQEEWVSETLQNEGRYTITAPHPSQLPPEERIVVSVCQAEKILLAPVTIFRNNIIAMGLFILLVTIGITYIIARQLTEPIRSIRESISELSLTDLSASSEHSASGSTYELTALSQAYRSMVERLEQSLEETVTARSCEIEARMLALQAQMNSHFLYNTITTISIRAEQHGDDDVVEMCRCLTAMLRYITPKKTTPSIALYRA